MIVYYASNVFSHVTCTPCTSQFPHEIPPLVVTQQGEEHANRRTYFENLPLRDFVRPLSGARKRLRKQRKEGRDKERERELFSFFLWFYVKQPSVGRVRCDQFVEWGRDSNTEFLLSRKRSGKPARRFLLLLWLALPGDRRKNGCAKHTVQRFPFESFSSD